MIEETEKVLPQALKTSGELIFEKLDIFNNIFIRPFTSSKILYEWEKLADQHRRQVGGRGFQYEILHIKRAIKRRSKKE